MQRVVNLTRTGVFVVIEHGLLLTLDGRCFWSSADEALRAARRTGAPLYERVLDTRP